MRVWAVVAVGLIAGCARPASPAPDNRPIRELLDRLQVMSTDGGHGPYHRANNALQRDLWILLAALGPGSETPPLLLEAAECVYTRYDENYYNGILWHWPYLSSRRAIDLCERILQVTPDTETRERALWIKAFALRCPATEPWADAERDMETYAEQARWKPDFVASREVYKTIARDFAATPRGKASARLVNQPDLSLVLPKGPKEPDPRNPDR